MRVIKLSGDEIGTQEEIIGEKRKINLLQERITAKIAKVTGMEREFTVDLQEKYPDLMGQECVFCYIKDDLELHVLSKAEAQIKLKGELRKRPKIPVQLLYYMFMKFLLENGLNIGVDGELELPHEMFDFGGDDDDREDWMDDLEPPDFEDE